MAKTVERPRFHEFQINGTTVGIGTLVSIDDKEIHGVRSVDYHIGSNELSTITLEIVPERCNLTDIGDVELTVDIDSLYTAIKCIQFEMKLNKEFKDAVIASARSALADCKVENSEEIAKAVVDRIFLGEDEWYKS